jgi:hypothetical protein
MSTHPLAALVTAKVLVQAQQPREAHAPAPAEQLSRATRRERGPRMARLRALFVEGVRLQSGTRVEK